MAAKLVSSLVPSFFSPFQPRRSFQFRPSRQHPTHLHCYPSLQLKTDKTLHISFKDHKQRKVSRKQAYLPLPTSEEQSQYTEDTSNDPETVSPQIVPEATPQDGSSTIKSNGNDGKSGFISFYNPRNRGYFCPPS
ncbi:unnamed protein product [Microthlaspi erraticum]|uniref:Uncharacterized protein n=1 Tax=Microthlaspi erraticum TaxID=1685480 RepID=A0A6D2L995_9BRAS|nr:unnamed protein product [Microthlaspi erraticum]